MALNGYTGGPDFRNEGMDPHHNLNLLQWETMLLTLTSKMLWMKQKESLTAAKVVQMMERLLPDMKSTLRELRRITMVDAVKEKTGIDFSDESMTDEMLRS